MRVLALALALLWAGCADLGDARSQFCERRPELCGGDAAVAVEDSGTDAGGETDAGVDAGVRLVRLTAMHRYHQLNGQFTDVARDFDKKPVSLRVEAGDGGLLSFACVTVDAGVCEAALPETATGWLVPLESSSIFAGNESYAWSHATDIDIGVDLAGTPDSGLWDAGAQLALSLTVNSAQPWDGGYFMALSPTSGAYGSVEVTDASVPLGATTLTNVSAKYSSYNYPAPLRVQPQDTVSAWQVRTEQTDGGLGYEAAASFGTFTNKNIGPGYGSLTLTFPATSIRDDVRVMLRPGTAAGRAASVHPSAQVTEVSFSVQAAPSGLLLAGLYYGANLVYTTFPPADRTETFSVMRTGTWQRTAELLVSYQLPFTLPGATSTAIYTAAGRIEAFANAAAQPFGILLPPPLDLRLNGQDVSNGLTLTGARRELSWTAPAGVTVSGYQVIVLPLYVFGGRVVPGYASSLLTTETHAPLLGMISGKQHVVVVFSLALGGAFDIERSPSRTYATLEYAPLASGVITVP